MNDSPIFLRWAGGKRWLVKQMLELTASLQINNYHEPFLGGGAVFFGLNPLNSSYLSDINPELVNAYIQVRDNPDLVIDTIMRYENTEEDYYRVRSLRTDNPSQRAGNFIFLNQTSFNGIYRVNKNGVYNVPYGNRKKWHFSPEIIREASLRLKKTTINCFDFENSLSLIRENDFVFLDPPYAVPKNEGGFLKYNAKLFSINDQERLARFVDVIEKKHAFYVLTNAAHPQIESLFKKNNLRVVRRPNLVGGKNAVRNVIEEYMFTNIEEPVK